ncbi:hypothetical protein C4K09_5607 [Pseudomonas chlororaphis subsp. aureofaciens]|nr:hypothetical protein C4K09_5607 [Pseudomonas chlororaphis subsp. aureofaciens]
MCPPASSFKLQAASKKRPALTRSLKLAPCRLKKAIIASVSKR